MEPGGAFRNANSLSARIEAAWKRRPIFSDYACRRCTGWGQPLQLNHFHFFSLSFFSAPFPSLFFSPSFSRSFKAFLIRGSFGFTPGSEPTRFDIKLGSCSGCVVFVAGAEAAEGAEEPAIDIWIARAICSS